MKLELSDKEELYLVKRALEVYRDYVGWRTDWTNEAPFKPKVMQEIAVTTQSDTEHLIEKISNLRDLEMVHADNLNDTHIQDNNGNWRVAKPIEGSSFFQRLKDAWRVLKGEYVAVKFWCEK